jgi:hypothetical protein
MYRVTSTDTQGRFQVAGLPPGDYKIFAWENIESNGWMDGTFIDAYENRGQPFHLDEGKTLSGDLPVISLR